MMPVPVRALAAMISAPDRYFVGCHAEGKVYTPASSKVCQTQAASATTYPYAITKATRDR